MFCKAALSGMARPTHLAGVVAIGHRESEGLGTSSFARLVAWVAPPSACAYAYCKQRATKRMPCPARQLGQFKPPQIAQRADIAHANAPQQAESPYPPRLSRHAWRETRLTCWAATCVHWLHSKRRQHNPPSSNPAQPA